MAEFFKMTGLAFEAVGVVALIFGFAFAVAQAWRVRDLTWGPSKGASKPGELLSGQCDRPQLCFADDF